MVIRRMGDALYNSLNNLRTKSVKKIIEGSLDVKATNSFSTIIGILMEQDAYEAFIPVSNKVASINLRDILGIRNITSTKPSLIGKLVPSLTYESNLGYAARIMSSYGLRSLPVVQDSKIIGQVNVKSIAKSIKDTGIKVGKASDIMTPNPIVLRANDKASSGKGMMIKHKIDHLPVMEEKRLAGIVTSSHMVRATLPSERIGRRSLGVDKIIRLDFPVISIADRDVITSKPQDTLQSVIGSIIDMNSTYSVVKVWDEIQGIITYRDIVALLAERIEEDIPSFIVGLPEDPFDAELAKTKFTGLIKLLRKVSPDIEEARCSMKIRNMQGQRRRYEVGVNIITPTKRHTYTNAGWDLAKIFDEISDGLKKKLAHRPTRKKRSSVRYRTDHYTS